jgi:zinc/manganese transport system ATP-binding protein
MSVLLNNLTVSYRKHPAVHHLRGEFATGSLTAVVGPNGAGKSTLLKSIAGLLPIHKPKAHIQKDSSAAHAYIELRGGSQHLAYLPQHSDLDRSFPISVYDCVSTGLWQHVGACTGVSLQMHAQVQAALEQVGLQGLAQRPISTLSSGQLQRTLFARLLVQDAQLILLDEPFIGIDSKTTATLLNITRQWHQEGRTVIVVLHDDAQVSQLCPQTLMLARECIAWGATADVLTAANWQRARAMVEAWDDTAAICDIDAQVNGQDFDTLLALRLSQAAQP